MTACGPGRPAAVEVGHAVLSGGGSALDAVEAAVSALEDDPAFNAGRGAALTEDGGVELDAAVMEGTGRGAGSVAVCAASATGEGGARGARRRPPRDARGNRGAGVRPGQRGWSSPRRRGS